MRNDEHDQQPTELNDKLIEAQIRKLDAEATGIELNNEKTAKENDAAKISQNEKVVKGMNTLSLVAIFSGLATVTFAEGFYVLGRMIDMCDSLEKDDLVFSCKSGSVGTGLMIGGYILFKTASLFKSDNSNNSSEKTQSLTPTGQ